MVYDLSHSVRRFGLGAGRAEVKPSAATDWLVAQLEHKPVGPGNGPCSVTNAVVIQRKWEEALKAGGHPTYGMSNLFDDEMDALLRQAVTTDQPFRERLVWFWANHFTVSSRAGGYTFGFVGAYIQDAIRPHVTGRFVDLLKAVMRHPAMLYYLNNHESKGPNSLVGMKKHGGLNENLARECLELHTLGVHGGYTQRDVTDFAKILTGRSIDFDPSKAGFIFDPDAHEPGEKTFLGQTFPEGLAGSEAALDFIATHPATYRHISARLLRHFVADDPPPSCVEQLAGVLAKSGGDLKQAVLAILDLPEAWVPLTKVRAPAEYAVAVLRALGLRPERSGELHFATRDLGQPFMGPLLPNGWPDTAADWTTGESLLRRADWALTQAQRPGAPDVNAVLEATLGDLCSATTRAAIKRCPNNAEALATLFVSPEFLRR